MAQVIPLPLFFSAMQYEICVMQLQASGVSENLMTEIDDCSFLYFWILLEDQPRSQPLLPLIRERKPARHITTRPHRSRNTETRCNRCCSPRTPQLQSLLCAFDSACRISPLRAYDGPLPVAAESCCPLLCVPLLLQLFLSIPPRCRLLGACGARLVECPGKGIPGGGSAGSAAIETVNRSVDSAWSAPSPMPFKKPGAVMAGVWLMSDAEVKQSPPPLPALTPQASLDGDDANAVKPVATPS